MIIFPFRISDYHKYYVHEECASEKLLNIEKVLVSRERTSERCGTGRKQTRYTADDTMKKEKYERYV